MPKRNPMIAIVDDEESVCRALKRLVQSLGFDAQTFWSGDEFLESVRGIPGFRPDCVILDVQMPGTKGLAVQEQLAQTDRSPPVIIITAHDAPGVRERALSGGAIAFLRKPFSDEQLVQTLHQALDVTGEQAP